MLEGSCFSLMFKTIILPGAKDSCAGRRVVLRPAESYTESKQISLIHRTSLHLIEIAG